MQVEKLNGGEVPLVPSGSRGLDVDPHTGWVSASSASYRRGLTPPPWHDAPEGLREHPDLNPAAHGGTVRVGAVVGWGAVQPGRGKTTGHRLDAVARSSATLVSTSGQRHVAVTPPSRPDRRRDPLCAAALLVLRPAVAHHHQRIGQAGRRSPASRCGRIGQR